MATATPARVSRLAFLLVPVGLAAVLAAPAACTTAAPAPNPAYSDVVFQGTATDTALTALLAAKPTDDPALAAYFDSPANLTELMPTPIVTFTWHDGQTSALQLLPRPAKRASFRSFTGVLTGVLADLFGEGTAHAQGPAMSGPGYLLVFNVLGGAELFRVFTSQTSYTPDAASWAKMATGNWTQLQITSATFAGDEVAANGGPYSGEVLKFCVGEW
jgi:hypothetical protein